MRARERGQRIPPRPHPLSLSQFLTRPPPAQGLHALDGVHAGRGPPAERPGADGLIASTSGARAAAAVARLAPTAGAAPLAGGAGRHV